MVDEADAKFIAALESALSSTDLASAALHCAVSWRDEGMSRSQMYRIFDVVRERHQEDPDQSVLDVLLDTMDFIGGWCSPHMRLYPDQHP